MQVKLCPISDVLVTNPNPTDRFVKLTIPEPSHFWCPRCKAEWVVEITNRISDFDKQL